MPSPSLSVSETEAFILFHLSRGNTRRHLDEVPQFEKMAGAATRIAMGLATKSMLDEHVLGYEITDVGRVALKAWRQEHEGDFPLPPWRRSGMADA